MVPEQSVRYIARLIRVGHVEQTLEFEAANDSAAWVQANEGVDPLSGLWVALERAPEPQKAMELPPGTHEKAPL